MSDTDHIYSIFKIALDILVAYVKNANVNECYTCLVIHHYKQEYNNTVIPIHFLFYFWAYVMFAAKN